MAEDGGYRWETEYEKTWEALVEDESGSLRSSIVDIVNRAKRRHLLDRATNIRLGMMRHVFLILDMSTAMEDKDLKPTRFVACLKLLEQFVTDYFDHNPICQLGILTSRDKRCDWLTALGGNPRRHIAALQSLSSRSCSGEFSLQNSLDLATQTLRHMPGHASREVLLIVGSLTTCDPGDIQCNVQNLRALNIQCSLIGMSAEVYIYKTLCVATNGRYNVIMDERHLADLLKQQVPPPPATADTKSSLIKMGMFSNMCLRGISVLSDLFFTTTIAVIRHTNVANQQVDWCQCFPHHGGSNDRGSQEKVSMCTCHLDSAEAQTSTGGSGYFCPQCRSRYCELPVECRTCGLTLVSAPHLARSYHHLFLPEPYNELLTSDTLSDDITLCCSSCLVQIQDQHVYRCEKCHHVYCLDCDIFIHETLHSCPGCASMSSHV